MATLSTEPVLPAEFADLEPYADWCLEFEHERYAKRLASSMDELQAFYDAAFPRLEEAIAHLDRLDLNALPDDARRLLWLCYSLVNVSFPVEVWRQPTVPDAGASAVDAVVGRLAAGDEAALTAVARLGDRLGEAAEPLRDALAQLRVAFVQISERAEAGESPDSERA